MKAKLASHPRVDALRRMIAIALPVDVVVAALGDVTAAQVRSYARSRDYRDWVAGPMLGELAEALPLSDDATRTLADLAPEPPRPTVGRSHYDPDLADTIVRRIADGDTLEKMTHPELGDGDLPSRATLWTWMQQVPSFGQRVEAARDYQSHYLVEEALRLCRDALDEHGPRLTRAQVDRHVEALLADLEADHPLDREVAEVVVARCLAIARQRTDPKVLKTTVAQLQWVAEKRLRRRYGETKVSGDLMTSLAQLFGMRPDTLRDLVDQAVAESGSDGPELLH